MKHERESIFFREMIQLFVQHRSLVFPEHLRMGIRCGNFKIGIFCGRLPESVGLDLQGNTKRDLVQPTAHGALSTNGARLSTQDQEGRLKGILGIVSTMRDAAAGSEHHWPVSPEQSLKGGLVVLADK